MFVGVSAFAQTKTVTGRIIGGDDQQGIPGATVLVKEANRGQAADVDGNYSIQVAQGQTLQFSAIGYLPSSIVVGDGNQINVTLQPDVSMLTAAVVVGYGTQKKENLTGAVASIDVNKTLDSRPISDVGRGLQGVTPGLAITNPSGEVGSDPTIKIRGAVASYEGSTTPLILYDNVEIPSISIINPDDVESISILKDAASASIYGAKAAFGVILITSKRGSRTDKVTVSYNNNFSWQNAAYDIDMAGVDGLKYTIDASRRTGGSGVVGAFWYVDERSLANAIAWKEKYGNTVGSHDPVVYGRDWYVNPGSSAKMGLRTYSAYDHMVREWAPSQTHNLSVNGRSGNTTYNLGLGYLLQSGMMKPAKKDEFERYNASLTVTTEVNKWFTAKANFIYSKRDKRYPYMTSSTTADPWLYLYRWGPLYPMAIDENGNALRSPASEAAAANTASLYNGYTSVNIGGIFTFTPNWTLNADFTYSENNHVHFKPGTRYTAGDTWVAAVPRLAADGTRMQVVDEWGIGETDSYQLNYTTYTAAGANPDHIYTLSAQAQRTTTNIYSTYELNLAENHAFKFMLGMNRTTYKEKSNWSQITRLLDVTNPQFGLTDGVQTSGGGFAWNSTLGYFGRVNYAFKDKYLLEANVRYDGTSKFPGSLAWRWFTSASAGWKISDEAFFEALKPIWSTAKLRASYGIIGDQTVPNDLYLATMSRSTSGWLSGGSVADFYYGTPSLVSAAITWQDIETINIGFESRFFNNKLGVTLDWFKRTTKNMIVAGVAFPTAFGAGSPRGNFGSLETSGWEVSVDFNHRFQNGLGINLMASLSDYKSKITKYSEGASETVTNNNWWSGRVYGDIYGYTTDRLYTWEDFVLVGDGSKKITNLQRVKLGATSVSASEAAAGVIADPNAGRNYGKSAGTIVFMQNNHETAVYQGGLQSGALIFGPGDVRYKDLDGDGDIYYGTGVRSDMGDLSKIGNSTPRLEYGIRLGADWKGFDFSIFAQGIGKRNVQPNGFLGVAGFNPSDGAMPQAIAGDYWTWNETTQTGRTNAYYPRAVALGSANPNYTSFNNTVQSRYLLDMSYFRIKNITFGYTLPESIVKKAFLNKARVYVSIENYFTFDNLNGLPIDPEEVGGYSLLDTSNYNGSRTGVGTPTFKSFSFGIQLTF